MASDQKLRITNDNDDEDETIMIKVNKLIRMNPPVPLSLETPLLRLRTVAERHLRLGGIFLDFSQHFHIYFWLLDTVNFSNRSKIYSEE